MEILLQDFRRGLRGMRRSPWLTAVVAITIALGVGANTAIFGLVNGFLIRPLPVPHPEQLTVLAIQEKNSALGALGFSYPGFIAFRQQAAGFCEVFGQALARSPGLTADGRTDQIAMTAVTGNFFSGMGVKAAAGRLILPSEGETPGEQAVLVLGYSFWQKRFGGDRSIVGKQVRINGNPAEIIGVVPKEFHGSFSPFEMDAYVSLSGLFPGSKAPTFWTDRNMRAILAMGRLRSGVSMAQAQSMFDVISAREAAEFPGTEKGFSVRVLPERLARPIPYANTQVVVISVLFLVLSAVVLLLACANVANILMARALSRARELAIQTALGANLVRLVRQTLTETMLLAALGGSLGVLLGIWLDKLGSSIHLPNFPLHLDSSFDWTAFTYALAVIVFAGILLGLSAALKATTADVNVLLHQGRNRDNRGVGRHRVRVDLTVVQVAGCLTLLIVAGLFIRSVWNAERTNLGFDPEHVLNVTLDPEENGYNTEQTKEFYRDLKLRIQSLPGVQSESLASSVPISSFPSKGSIYLEGQATSSDHPLPPILFNRVDPGYFRTMRVPLPLGREFSDSDSDAAPLVAIVNQTMANRLWPRQQPIGKRFSMTNELGPFLEVIGVAEDGKYQGVAEEPQPYFYLPLAQNYTSLRILQIRSSLPSASLIKQVDEKINAIDRNVSITDTRTMDESLEGGTGFFIFRLGASLAFVIGILGLILAVIGVYGMVAFTVTKRTREIGTRVALGANPYQVVRLVVAQGMKTVLGGAFLGLLSAWIVARMTTHLLVGVSSSDPVVYVAVSVLVCFVGALACYIPARRAARIDPMVALRYE
jgi:predicted permease